MSPSISVIVPTIGRSSLRRTLESFVGQLCVDDEVLIVGDGPQPVAAETAEDFKPLARYVEYGPDHCYGHPQRNYAMSIARGAYLAFMDDDDTYLPEAFDNIRRSIEERPHVPMLFRVRLGPHTIWRAPKVVRTGNVSTQMIVVPNQRSRLGRWGRQYSGDRVFIGETLQRWPPEVVAWREEIVAVVPASSRGKWF